MPLPDERPRQSVANLIGRFEQQTKRTSLSASTSAPQRLFSVSQHNTGDSPKEEVKEKREWSFPQTPAAKANVALDPPASIVTKPASPPVSSIVESTIAASVSAPQGLTVTAEPEPIQAHKALATPPESPPTKPVSPKISKQSISNNAPNHSRTSTTTTASIPRSISKATASKVVSSPARPPPVKPLKPQLTGQSTTSTTSTVRARSRIGLSAPSTPSNNRASIPVRPKTPSGLYAPTAASLAKARGAVPPVPTPTRKATNAAAVKDVMERLSKPTAASASKSRTPVASSTPTTPARTRTVSTIAKGSAPVKTIVKPKANAPTLSAAEKAKQEKERKAKVMSKAAGAVIAGAGAGAVATAKPDKPAIDVEPELVYEVPVETVDAITLPDVAEPSTEEPLDQPAEDIESYDEDFLDDTVIHDQVRGISEEVLALEAERSVGDMFASDYVEGGEKVEEKLGEESTEEGKVDQIESPSDVDVSPVDSPSPAPAAALADSGDDLVNLVKMLERPPQPRVPSDASSIPDLDQAGVIPDDED